MNPEEMQELQQKISKLSTDELRKIRTRKVVYGVGDPETRLAMDELENRERKENLQIGHDSATSTSRLVKATWGLVVVTAILSIVTFIGSVRANKIALNQLELSQEPIIRVVPEKTVIGNDVASFKLSLRNAGLSDIVDVEIYEDYFVAQKLPDMPILLHRFGIFSIEPNHTISTIKKGQLKDFQIEFKETHKQMLDFYLSDTKGFKMKLLRLIVRYRREIDGHEFSFSKVFFMDFSGKFLLDSYPRKVNQEFFPEEEAKAVLGIR